MAYMVRKAQMEDLPRIQQIYAYAREFMAASGNPNQWGTSYPPAGQLVEDICNAQLYVVVDGEWIHGVFYFSIGIDETYLWIQDGAWHWDQIYGTIHRIASDGSGGILRTAVEYCAQRIGYLRIDTHHDNQVMQKALERLGFRPCGIIYVADGSPRIAYDRV